MRLAPRLVAVERKALAVLSGHSIVRLLLVGVAQPREVLAGRGDDDGAVDPLAKPRLPAFCSLLCKRRFVSDDSAARNGRTASVSAIECRVVQPAGGESVGVAPHRRCTVRNGAGLRPALKVKVWAAQPAPRASVRCPLPPSVVWLSAPRVASATAEAPTRAGTTCAAEQAYMRARSPRPGATREQGTRRARIEGAALKSELSGRVQRWRGARQSRVHQPVSGVSRRRRAGRRT